MNCDRIASLLSSYHDDALSLEERARVRAHVATCQPCHSILTTYEQIYAVLRQPTAPVPVDLRRGVYARLSEIEARKHGGFVLGGSLVGAIRGVGGTAGLLAVLAALVAALVRLGSPQVVPSSSLAGGAHEPSHHLLAAAAVAPVATVGAAVLDSMVGSGHLGVGIAAAATVAQAGLPATAGPVHVIVTSIQAFGAQHVAFSGDAVRIDAQGHETQAIPFHGAATYKMDPAQGVTTGHALHPRIVHVTGITAVPGTPSPVPTLPTSDGLLMVHLDNAHPFVPNMGNANAEIEYHSFAAGGPVLVVVTPVADQLITGVNAAPDGNSAAYSAKSSDPRYGGIFALGGDRRPEPRHLVTLTDVVATLGGHRYAPMVYFTTRGAPFFPLTEGMTTSLVISEAAPTVAASEVVMVGNQRLSVITQTTQQFYNLVYAPDLKHWALVAPQRDAPPFYGSLHIVRSESGAQVMIRDASGGPLLASHPVWSPDGGALLFLGRRGAQSPPALWLWTPMGGARPLASLPPGDSHLFSTFTWAPGGRFCAYLLTTIGSQGTSAVWIADTLTGWTARMFERSWIGAIAWVHGSAVAEFHQEATATASVATATATSVVPPTPSALSVPPTPTPFDAMAHPQQALLSFYNAIARHDYRRAYGYLASSDGRSLAQFTRGYTDTATVAVVSLIPAPYLNADSPSATTCVGIALQAWQRDGRTTRYGGWYLLRSVGGQGSHGVWRLVVNHGSHILPKGSARVPLQSACHVAAPLPTATAAA